MTITVVTPSLNQARFLERAIESVFQQNDEGLEYILMDGGSSDGSLEIIRRHAARFAHWQSEADGGQTEAIVNGLDRGSGDILCWLNSDDYFADGAIAAVCRHFREQVDCQWLAGSGLIVDEYDHVRKEVRAGRLDTRSLLDWEKNPIVQPSVFWRRSLWQQVGGLDRTLELAMDYDLWLKFAAVVPGEAIPDVLSSAVQHPAMKSRVASADSFVETCLVQFRHGDRESAIRKLTRVVRRAYELDTRLSFLTRNPLYRRWRDRQEEERHDDRH